MPVASVVSMKGHGDTGAAAAIAVALALSHVAAPRLLVDGGPHVLPPRAAPVDVVHPPLLTGPVALLLLHSRMIPVAVNATLTLIVLGAVLSSCCLASATLEETARGGSPQVLG